MAALPIRLRSATRRCSVPGASRRGVPLRWLPTEMASTSERRERALGAEEPSEFQGTHWYNPVGWDRFDPRPHPGSGAIAPGARVQSFGPMRGAPKAGKMTFHHIRDEAGNEQSVFKGSLSRKRPQV